MTSHTLASSSSPIDDSLKGTVTDFIRLLKPGVMSLVVFTGLVGMIMAPGTLHPYLAFLVVLSIALGSGASAAINMWFDADIDKIMKRTQNRPIPAGRLGTSTVLQFGILLGGASLILLYLATGWLAASVLAFSMAFYVVIYTMWLKRSTPQNIVIGGAAGAFPPVIGWTAVTGSLSFEPLLYFAIIFFWTPPHFWALALYKSGEYAKAAVPMLPVTAGIQATKRQIFGYSLVLFVTTVLPLLYQFSGLIYGVAAITLGATFIYLAYRVLTSEEEGPARKLFAYSIFYLFLLFAALVLDKILL